LRAKGQAAVIASSEMLKLARCLHLLIASLATLPSMSLIPFVPFASKAGYSEASTIGDRRYPPSSDCPGDFHLRSTSA